MTDKKYNIDKNTEELWIFDSMFITRLKNYVNLDSYGEYLYYDSNNAVHIRTDFSRRLNVISHVPGINHFFNKSCLIFGDSSILVFDSELSEEILPGNKTIISIHDDRIPEVITKKRSMLSCISSPDSSKDMFSSSLPDPEIHDVIYSRTVRPQKIKQELYGYPISGFYLKVFRAPGKVPHSYQVNTILGEETQEQFVKLLHAPKER